MSIRHIISATLLLSLGLGAPLSAAPAPEEAAAAPTTAIYWCVIGINPASNDCVDGVVVPQPTSSINQRRAQVNLKKGFNWKTFVLRVETCNPSGWTVHIGDSPSNNGFGGDAADTQHDAEAQALNNILSVYESDIGTSQLTCKFTGPPSPTGCIVQQYFVQNDFFEFDPNVNLASNPLSICGNGSIFDFPFYDEFDAEDPFGQFENQIYVGLNQTYGSASRNGTGIQRGCFFLSTDLNPSDSLIGSVCGF